MTDENVHKRPDSLDYNTWRAALSDGDLLGQQCSECGQISGTPRRNCKDCGSPALETVDLPASGIVYSETEIAVTPAGFDESSYRVGIVDLGKGRVLARLDGNFKIGDEVELQGIVDDSGDPAPVFG